MYLCLRGTRVIIFFVIVLHCNVKISLLFNRNNTQSTSVDTIDGPMSCGIRRHSIGTFVGRDKRCGSISDEVNFVFTETKIILRIPI